jgi:hypothetical protein
MMLKFRFFSLKLLLSSITLLYRSTNEISSVLYLKPLSLCTSCYFITLTDVNKIIDKNIITEGYFKGQKLLTKI